MKEVDRRGIAAIVHDAMAYLTAGSEGTISPLYMSFDLDVLDPNIAGGVGTPVAGGLTYREAHLAMELVAATGAMVSMDLVEVNPIRDTENRTAPLAIELASSAFGKQIL